MTLALIGGAAGLGAAALVARVLSSLLYSVRPADPLTFIIASSVLLGAALAACFVPAHRATTVDPIVALRHE